MFVYSLRGSTVKFVGALLSLAVVTGVIITLMPQNERTTDTFGTSSKIVYDGMESNENLLEFVRSLGIETANEPVEIVETEIPASFDTVYQQYEEIQKKQGLKLSKYKGKAVTRYTYEILNYPKNESNEPNGKVFLNLLVYKKRVIGGDICSAEMGGFVTGFTDFKGASPKI